MSATHARVFSSPTTGVKYAHPRAIFPFAMFLGLCVTQSAHAEFTSHSGAAAAASAEALSASGSARVTAAIIRPGRLEVNGREIALTQGFYEACEAPSRGATLSSAASKATSIRLSQLDDVSVTATTLVRSSLGPLTLRPGGVDVEPDTRYTLDLNGVTVINEFGAPGDEQEMSLAQVVEQINAVRSQTATRATVDAALNQLVLFSPSGADITLESSVDGEGAAVSVPIDTHGMPITVRGVITLSSNTGDIVIRDELNALGFGTEHTIPLADRRRDVADHDHPLALHLPTDGLARESATPGDEFVRVNRVAINNVEVLRTRDEGIACERVGTGGETAFSKARSINFSGIDSVAAKATNAVRRNRPGLSIAPGGIVLGEPDPVYDEIYELYLNSVLVVRATAQSSPIIPPRELAALINSASQETGVSALVRAADDQIVLFTPEGEDFDVFAFYVAGGTSDGLARLPFLSGNERVRVRGQLTLASDRDSIVIRDDLNTLGFGHVHTIEFRHTRE